MHLGEKLGLPAQVQTIQMVLVVQALADVAVFPPAPLAAQLGKYLPGGVLVPVPPATVGQDVQGKGRRIADGGIIARGNLLRVLRQALDEDAEFTK